MQMLTRESAVPQVKVKQIRKRSDATTERKIRNKNEEKKNILGELGLVNKNESIDRYLFQSRSFKNTGLGKFSRLIK